MSFFLFDKMVVYFVTFQVIYVKDFPLYSENISAIFFSEMFCRPSKIFRRP